MTLQRRWRLGALRCFVLERHLLSRGLSADCLFSAPGTCTTGGVVVPAVTRFGAIQKGAKPKRALLLRHWRARKQRRPGPRPSLGRGTGHASCLLRTASFQKKTAAEATIVMTLNLERLRPISVTCLQKDNPCSSSLDPRFDKFNSILLEQQVLGAGFACSRSEK